MKRYEMAYTEYDRGGEGTIRIVGFEAPSDNAALMFASPIHFSFGCGELNITLTGSEFDEYREKLQMSLSDLADEVSSCNGDGTDFLYWVRDCESGEYIFEAYEVVISSMEECPFPEELINLEKPEPKQYEEGGTIRLRVKYEVEDVVEYSVDELWENKEDGEVTLEDAIETFKSDLEYSEQHFKSTKFISAEEV